MRVVLDTNVLISAFVFPGGPPERVWRLALEGRMELCTSIPLLTEFGRILIAKFGWEPARAEDAVRLVASIGTIVEPSERISAIENDPDDNRVLEAVSAEADAILSGDRHLLRLGAWGPTRIVAPAEFLTDLG